MTNHWFWLSIVGGTLVWYVIITAVVALRGYKDIRTMLKGFRSSEERSESSGS